MFRLLYYDFMAVTVTYIVQAHTTDFSRYDRGLHHYPPLLAADTLREKFSNTFKNFSEGIDPEKRVVAFCLDKEFETNIDPDILQGQIEDTFRDIISLVAEGLREEPQAVLCYIMGSCLASLKEYQGVTPECNHRFEGPEPFI